MIVGECGIDRNTLLHELKFWEIRSIIRGHYHRNADILNMIRNHGYWMLSAVCGKSFSDNTSITDLMPFDWDEQPEPIDMTDEEYKSLIESIKYENNKIEQ